MDDQVECHPLYLLTCDLALKMQCLGEIGIKVPESQDAFYANFDRLLADKIQSLLPGASVCTFDIGHLTKEILGQALEFQNVKIVSYCCGLGNSDCYTLQINRLIGQNGEGLGLGPRPGFTSVGIEALDKEQEVVLIDDGSFSGSTMLSIIEKFQVARIPIRAIIVGFNFPESLKKVREKFSGEIISIVELKNPIDWMPDHDFFPFAPNCGKVRGFAGANGPVPLVKHGATYSVPYLLPFVSPVVFNDWTSLPADAARDFSLFCAQQSLHFFQRLEDLNGRRLQIMDILGSVPRASIPIALGQTSFPLPDSAITDFLSDVCHELI